LYCTYYWIDNDGDSDNDDYTFVILSVTLLHKVASPFKKN